MTLSSSTRAPRRCAPHCWRDWLTPTADLLNDRGMMGDGVIDLPRIRGWVEAQGFAGYSEVEIFSAGNWWQRDRAEVLDTCIQRHRSAV